MPKILVIDDEEALRVTIRSALQKKQYEVIEAGSGAQGQQMAFSHRPQLILCDVVMEGGDGYSVLQALRSDSSTAAIPFILMTGQANPAGMRQGMQMGADDYLAKPFTMHELLAAVEARFQKQAALQQQAERKLAELRSSITLALPHELRTPLNGIIGFGEILSAEAATLQPEEIAEMGRAIHQSGNRLERLIEQFLIYAQIELIAADPARAAALRQGQAIATRATIETSARRRAERTGRLGDLQLELQEASICISQDFLSRLVDELVSNAFKFSKAPSPVRVGTAVSNREVTLTVTDRGVGLKPEHLAEVGAFVQFERKFRAQEGTGLGLAIVRQLADLHGGRFSLQSEPGAGATAIVKFPLASS
jgi:signal transduction histidine kinase